MNNRNLNHHLRQLISDYLSYNRTEQRGIIVLSLILLGLVVANTVIPAGTYQETPDFSSFESEVRAFETAWLKAADSDSMARMHKYLNNGKRFGYKFGDSMKFIKPAVPIVIIELNAADTLDLQQLRGIGPGFARRIVYYRDKLHGFNDKRQVLEVLGMDTARYRLIESNLRVNPDSIRPMNLNTVTFKELLRHPYFPFPVTKNIMIYRQKNKMFKSLEELKQIEGINDSIFRRMVLYLRLGP
jgi:DNA uptake protein ComE-like DNA-binding protein